MDAFSNPMQNLFHIKRLSLRHRRYCFHKGFFPTKPLEKEIQWLYLICHTKRKFRITVCSIRSFFFFLETLIIFGTHILQLSISRKDWQWALLVALPSASSCSTQQNLLHTADKRASWVAIVILSCWALCYLEGNQMRTRSGEQYRVNVRQLKVICAIIFGDVWFAAGKDASLCKTLTHCRPNLMFGYLNIEFVMI